MSTSPEISRRNLIATASLAAAAGAGWNLANQQPVAAEPPVPRRVVASEIGIDRRDATVKLQAALDNTNTTELVLDGVPGSVWHTGPLTITRGDLRVVIQPGVTLQALKGAPFLDKYATLLTLDRVSDVTISGYGATLRMNRDEYPAGQYRTVLSLRQVDNVTVEGLSLRDSGGDGIYIGSRPESKGDLRPTDPSRNVTLRDLVCDNNMRCGLALIAGDHIHVEGCAFVNTNGHDPASGVDLEPNWPAQQLTNITFTECYFGRNNRQGFQLFARQLNGDSRAVSVQLDRSLLEANGIGDQGPNLTVAHTLVGGSVEVRDCVIRSENGSGSLLVERTAANRLRTVFAHSEIWNQSAPFRKYEPIRAIAGELPQFGNLRLDEVSVVTERQAYFHADSSGSLTNVKGEVTVYGVAQPAPVFGPRPVGVTLRTQTAPNDRATVTVRALSVEVNGGATAQFEVSRDKDTSRALAVAFTRWDGATAQERYDYGGLGRVVTIPAGQASVVLNIRTRPKADARRSLGIVVSAGPRYLSDGKPATTWIVD